VGVSNELARPNSEDDFEAMCHVLYGLVYNNNFSRVGGPGQNQFGVDILGHDGAKSIGIQCKHYNKKPFTLTTVKDDIKKVEDANLKIDHLLFATTAASKADVVRQVFELNSERIKEGKFSVYVNFWEDISGHIRLYPQVGRSFIPGFPGSTILEIQETVDTHFDLYTADAATRAKTSQETSEIFAMAKTLLERSNLQTNSIPAARGDEADPRVVASLDLIRDKLREGKCKDALELLNALGDPADFKDQFSCFRWHANFAFVHLLEGHYSEAAEGFLKAYPFAQDDEKANANRTHALILKKDFRAALSACEEGLAKFPLSEILWSLKVNILQSLGDTEPAKDIPEEITNSSDVLFGLAGVKSTKADYPAAIAFIKQSIAADGGSFNSKRVYLADALSWCASDPVGALHGQISKTQYAELAEAVAHFEPLEKNLPSIQSDHISEEVASNIVVSLVLLDQKDRAFALVNNLLNRHPLLENLLRIKLQELDEKNDIKAIHNLTDLHLNELPVPVIGILVEIAANQGDKAWYATLMEIVEKSDLEIKRLEMLRTFSILAEWKSGNKSEAVEIAYAYLEKNSDDVLTRVILSQMLKEFGKLDDAIKEALTAKEYLSSEANSLEKLQVAELLYQLQEFSEASSIYHQLVKEPGSDEFTKKLLICLVESDQRRKALDILNYLPAEIREFSDFRRIEANLARRMGNWSLMRDLLAIELDQQPENINVALNFLGAAYRLNELEVITKYLERDPRFKNSTLEAEFEFSKYQANQGLSLLALNRLYRQYRDNSSSTKAASYYLGQVLIGKSLPEMLELDVVASGCAVHLKSSSNSRCIVIDIDQFDVKSWPELISSNSVLFKKLLGLKKGEHVTLDSGLANSDYVVTNIESIYNFAARKAHELVSSAAEPTGPIYSVRVVNDDGTLDIQAILESAKQRREHVQRIFDTYKKYRFPIVMLAKSLGTDPVTLMFEWPYKEVPFFVGSGTHQERENSVKLIKENKARYVLDLLTIAELVSRKCFDSITKLTGRPLVPSTVREHLLMLIELANAPRESASIRENNGQLIMNDIPPKYHENRLSFLLEMQSCIDNFCEVVVTTGPQEVTDAHRLAAEALDHDSLDVIYLCNERNATLISEDGSFRLIATEAGVANSMGTQPLLMEACDTGVISKKVYADIVFSKLDSGHDFVSIRAEDMFTIARLTPYRVSDSLKEALDTFRRPTLDIVSGVYVCCEFIIRIILNIQPRISLLYIRYILEVLLFERLDLDKVIRESVSISILAALNDTKCKLKQRERKAYEEFLTTPEESGQANPKRPIPFTIQQLFYKK